MATAGAIQQQNGYDHRQAIVFVLLLTVLGAVLRCVGIGSYLTFDELSALNRTVYTSFADLIQQGVYDFDPHPAGTQVFLWLWCRLFGTGTVVVRLPFVLMGTACIPLMYLVGRDWKGRRAGLFAATAVAVSQFTIYYSLMARPYTMGLFFLLLALRRWTDMMFRRRFTWSNVVLFALFSSLCAYTHYFDALTAALLGMAGLFWMGKDGRLRYLSACGLAMLLFVPHLPITLHQLLDVQGIGGWLGAPSPKFILEYGRYLVHFSWLAFGTLLAVVALMSRHAAQPPSRRWSRGLTALLLGLLPLIIGYVYSVKVNPVLQKSCLIFSFPFLLLALTSLMEGDQPSKQDGVLLSLYAAVMCFSLIFVREHYRVIQKEWIGTSVAMADDCYRRWGRDRVGVLLDINFHSKLAYYEEQLGTPVDNAYESMEDATHVQNFVDTCHFDHLVVAQMTPEALFAIRQRFPHIDEYRECVGTEVYAFSRESGELSDWCGEDSLADEAPTMNPYPTFPMVERTFSDADQEPLANGAEYYMLLDTTLSALIDTRFTQLDLFLDGYAAEGRDVSLVIETCRGRRQTDWRNVPLAVSTEADSIRTTYLPLRYEMVVKEDAFLPLYRVKIYLYNHSHARDVRLQSFRVTATHTNPYMYALHEEIGRYKSKFRHR